MIIYEATKTEFIDDVVNEQIVERLYNVYQEKIGKTSKQEIRSWDNSLQRMSNVMQDQEIPEDVKVAIEFKIPNTGKRVDFIIAGNDGETDHAVIIELKQWEKVNKVETMDAVVVETALGGGMRHTTHPSYQAWTYGSLIESFNEEVQSRPIRLHPCAYLHNYRLQDNDPLIDPHYQDHIEKAPIFTKGELGKLRNFIKQYIKYGDQNDVIVRIDQGKIKPSKALQDALAGMLKGNQEFIMIDDQKIMYEQTLTFIDECIQADEKGVFIIKGGPGTGKSVLAINLLVKLIEKDYLAMYVTKNVAPRDVYAAKLKGTMKKTAIDNLFKGSGSFHSASKNEFDILIVDEAHRLNEKSGMFQNLGENQIKEIINSAKFSIFFIDEAQRVTLKDIGSVEEIRSFANGVGARIYEGELSSQFRCAGSDGYIAWLDDVLEIRDTANTNDLGMDYDIRVFDDPNQLLTEIETINITKNKSRIMAGYCWDWPKEGRMNQDYHDIQIPEYNFEISWNLQKSAWAIDQSTVREAGCIHTTQGLEFEYAGVIIGDDLQYRDGHVITDYTKRAKTDQSLKGIKKLAKENPEKAQKEADLIIRNTYRTLMTRGQKGCFIFCTDKALNEYLKERINRTVYEKRQVREMLLIDTEEDYGVN